MRTSTLLLALFILTGCSNDNYIDITDQCEFIQLFTNSCFWGIPNSEYDEIVFRDNEDFQTFVDSVRIYPANINCDTAIAPDIDFKNYVLCGKFTSGGGCDSDFKRKVYRDITNEEIIYQIDINYSGLCDMLITSRNLVLIPKSLIYEDVKFSVTKK